MTTSTVSAAEPLYPTTGEPVSTVARRARLGIWLCIISDAVGTVALLIAYTYLWSLNVNGAWAPPKDAWAGPLHFWLVFLGMAIATILMWWGASAIKAGHSGRLGAVALVATLLLIVTFVLQIIQLSTFPFGPSDGAYASATFWLCLSAAFHLTLVSFLVLGVALRTRAGRISPSNPTQARFVAMFMTWVTIAIFLGSFVATTMTVSPNDKSPAFGQFTSQG